MRRPRVCSTVKSHITVVNSCSVRIVHALFVVRLNHSIIQLVCSLQEHRPHVFAGRYQRRSDPPPLVPRADVQRRRRARLCRRFVAVWLLLAALQVSALYVICVSYHQRSVDTYRTFADGSGCFADCCLAPAASRCARQCRCRRARPSTSSRSTCLSSPMIFSAPATTSSSAQ